MAATERVFARGAGHRLVSRSHVGRQYLPFLDVPGTGYIVVLALFGSHHGAMIKGGSDQAPLALARSLYAAGGRVATHSKVARILVENNRAVGVELSDGRTRARPQVRLLQRPFSVYADEDD